MLVEDKRMFQQKLKQQMLQPRENKLNTCRASSLSTKAYQKFRGPAGWSKWKFRAWSETQVKAEAFEDSETAGFDDTESHKRKIDSLHEKRMS